jgi:uncharacterized Zn finger protein
MAYGNRRVLTRAELREVVYARCSGLTRGDVSEIFEAAVDEICDALAGPEPLKLHSFDDRRAAPSMTKRVDAPAPFSCASKSFTKGQ